jgi:hypothetical protein
MHLSTRLVRFRQSLSPTTAVHLHAVRLPGDATFAKGRKPDYAHNPYTIVLADALRARDDATCAGP